LEQIAAGCRHVAQLRRRAGQDGAGEQRVTALDLRVIGEVAVWDQRADPQPAVGRVLDAIELQPRDIDQP